MNRQCRQALIVSGGQTDPAQLAAEIRRIREVGGLFVAADSGLEAVKRLIDRTEQPEEAELTASGQTAFPAPLFLPDIAVGDFDSVSSDTLERFMQYHQIRFERHRPQKNESDTELAFTIAMESGAAAVTLMGATGTRLDHVLSNIHLLKEAMDRGLECCILDGHNRIRLTAGRMTFRRLDCPYPYISFVPLTMEVTHLKLTGFKYPLSDYHMVLGVECGHCISNEIAAEEAVLDFESGLVLVIESAD